MISEHRAEKAVEFIRDHADELGVLIGRCKALEHQRKTVYAQQFLMAEASTVAEREAKANASQAVAQVIEDIENAWADKDTLATKLKAAELTIDVWRSQYAASKRGHV